MKDPVRMMPEEKYPRLSSGFHMCVYIYIYRQTHKQTYTQIRGGKLKVDKQGSKCRGGFSASLRGQSSGELKKFMSPNMILIRLANSPSLGHGVQHFLLSFS